MRYKRTMEIIAEVLVKSGYSNGQKIKFTKKSHNCNANFIDVLYTVSEKLDYHIM